MLLEVVVPGYETVVEVAKDGGRETVVAEEDIAEDEEPFRAE